MFYTRGNRMSVYTEQIFIPNKFLLGYKDLVEGPMTVLEPKVRVDRSVISKHTDLKTTFEFRFTHLLKTYLHIPVKISLRFRMHA